MTYVYYNPKTDDILTDDCYFYHYSPITGVTVKIILKMWFKVNGYYGKYIILRSDRLGTHPTGKYLI